MKYLKIFEKFSLPEFKVGDMVYIDIYDPYKFSSFTQYINHSALAFRTRAITNRVFADNTKYKIMAINNGLATFYDENNRSCEIALKNLYFEKIDNKYIKECFISSFEDINFKTVNYYSYINSMDIIVEIKLDERPKFLEILDNEFIPRLEEDSLKVDNNFYGEVYQITILM